MTIFEVDDDPLRPMHKIGDAAGLVCPDCGVPVAYVGPVMMTARGGEWWQVPHMAVVVGWHLIPCRHEVLAAVYELMCRDFPATVMEFRRRKPPGNPPEGNDHESTRQHA